MTYEKSYDKAYDLYHTYMKQHVEGFNFFLVISGLLFNALIDIYEKYSIAVWIILCGFEMLISVAFFLLDIRSSKYMRMAKNVLHQIESEMCANGECKIGAITMLDLERDKLKSKIRMTYIFRVVYAAFFAASFILFIVKLF